MRKRLGTWVIVGIGVVLMLFSVYIKHRVNEAEQGFEKSKGLFSPFHKEPGAGSVGKMIEGKVEEKVAQYRHIAGGCLIAGIVLVIAGVVYGVFLRKR